MKPYLVLLASSASILLSACGGGGEDNAGLPGESIQATRGVFVTGGPSSLLGFITPYWQVVLEGGETWMVKDFNSRGEPIFFATGIFGFKDRVITTFTNTTTTTTITPERTVTEMSTVNSNPISRLPSQKSTRLSANDALISINSNLLAASGVSYLETEEANLPITGEDPDLRVPGSVRERVGVLTPAVGGSESSGVRIGLEAGSLFAYDRPADPQRLVGSWQFAFDRTNATMVVSNNGAFNGSNEATGCLFTGTLIPHPNGKNVFISSVTVTNCQAAGGYRGVAAAYSHLDATTDPGKSIPAIFLAAVDTSKSRVFSFAMFQNSN